MKRHATDLVSLIFGLLFVLAAAWWYSASYLDLSVNLDLPQPGWLLAGALIVLGLLGVTASLRRDRTPQPLAATAWNGTASTATASAGTAWEGAASADSAADDDPTDDPTPVPGAGFEADPTAERDATDEG